MSAGDDLVTAWQVAELERALSEELEHGRQADPTWDSSSDERVNARTLAAARAAVGRTLVVRPEYEAGEVVSPDDLTDDELAFQAFDYFWDGLPRESEREDA